MISGEEWLLCDFRYCNCKRKRETKRYCIAKGKGMIAIWFVGPNTLKEMLHGFLMLNGLMRLELKFC